MIAKFVDARARLSTAEQAALVMTALLPLAWAPRFVEPTTPRVAFALVLLPLGARSLLRQARVGDVAARLGMAFVGVGIVSALLSPAPTHAMVGSIQNWTGVVGFATALAWWACGREMSSEARRWILPALTIGAVWNGLLAVIQIVAQIQADVMYHHSGRAVASMQNPVYFGAFMAGVCSCWLARRSCNWASSLVVSVLALGVGLTGGRAAAGSVILVALWSIGARATRRAASTNLALTISAIIAGSMLSSAVEGGAALGDRAAGGGGFDIRLGIWRMALRAFVERPLFGWGPANIEIATERQFDLAYTRRYLSEDGSLLRWIDLHNVVLNVLVAFGAIGLVVAAAFVVASLRGSRRPVYLAGAFAIVANWMLEPMTIHTFPIALLLLGASAGGAASLLDSEHPSRDGQHDAREGFEGAKPSGRTGILVGLGCTVAFALLSSTFLVDFGMRTGRLGLARSSAQYGYRDHFLEDQLVTAMIETARLRSTDVSSAAFDAEPFVARAARRYPVVYTYERLGELQFLSGDQVAAREREREASAFQLWNPLVNLRLSILADTAGDGQDSSDAMGRLCAIESPACDDGLTGRP